MKNIICFILFVATSTVYSQNSIAEDNLYLQYEAAYIKFSTDVSPSISNLDKIANEFYSKLTDEKALIAFNKSKDKVKWLNKNIKKTSFLDAQEAIFLYSSMKDLEGYHDEQGKELRRLLSELKKKYNGVIIWETLKSRLEDNKKEEL